MATTFQSAPVHRPGQSNLGGDEQALFLKIFTGEVITALKRVMVTDGFYWKKTISGGKSAQFLYTGRTTPTAHFPGQHILEDQTAGQLADIKILTQLGKAEKVINIDRPLIRSAFFDDLDMAMAQYDDRAIAAMEIAEGIGFELDQRMFAVMLQGAQQTSGLVNTLPGGEVIYESTWGSNVANTIGAIFEMDAALTDKHVSTQLGERRLYVRPAIYNFLVNECRDHVLNTRYNPEGNGSVASGQIMRIANFEIVQAPTMPATTYDPRVVGGTGALANDYGPFSGGGGASDFTSVGALVCYRQAMGVVELAGAPNTTVKMGKEELRLGSYATAYTTRGASWVRPEGLGVIFATSAP